jgi:hypothetical protein
MILLCFWLSVRFLANRAVTPNWGRFGNVNPVAIATAAVTMARKMPSFSAYLPYAMVGEGALNEPLVIGTGL